MAPGQFWVFVVVISICVIPASLRSRREMMKAALPGEVEMLAQRSPVLVVHHGEKQGRGIVVRGIEHVYSDLHQMGIFVRKTEEPSLDAPFVEIKFLNSTFVFPGDPTQQAQVMRWALHTVECAKDAVVEVTEAQISILTRFLTSFSVIYGYGVPRSDLLWEQLAKTTNLCLKSGNTLIFKADGDLAPQSLYLPLEKEPALVLYAHNIPLIYTGNMEPKDILEWLAETHDTDTNMVKLSSRNLHRIVALERTVLVLFFLKSDPSPLIAQSNCSSRLDRLGVVAVGLENLEEVEGLGVEQLPALVMFKHGLPIIYSGEMTVDSLDKMLSWVSRETDRREKILITGIESLNQLSRKDFEVDHSHPSTILVKPHRDAVQKLSIEYARLARENERLRNIINTALTVLGDHEEKEIKPSSPLRAECGDCAGSIGQAIWDCGTLDIDCIK